MDEQAHRDYWLAQGRRLARRVNAGWWLEKMGLPLVTGSVVAAVGLLLVRRWQPEWRTEWLAAGCGGAFFLLAAGCWLTARRRFESPLDGLVRLEARMGLNNALSTAHAGVGRWPASLAVAEPLRETLDWRWSRLLLTLVGALTLLAAGLFIPLAPALPSAPPEQPQTWRQLTAELDRLAEEKVVDEKYIEETRQKLEELKAQDAEEWFSHSSLEATDSLKKSHQAEARQVQEELEKAAKAVESLQQANDAATNEQKKKLLDDYQQALQSLQNGAMKPNEKLLEQMKQLSPESLSQLTPEQMQQMKENLQKSAQGMKGHQPGDGSGEGNGDDWSDELLSGDGKDTGNGQKNGPGQGGVSRGPGHDPDVLGNEREPVETGDPVALKAKDLSRATPGDLLEVQDGEHDVDETATRLSDGGRTQAMGSGGERVWKDSLDPAEQRAVKRFFK